jgi:hypothetical protein
MSARLPGSLDRSPDHPDRDRIPRQTATRARLPWVGDNPMPTPKTLVACTAVLAALAACASAPRFDERIEAAAAHLDSGRSGDAVDFLRAAIGVTERAEQTAFALAMLVEAHLAMGDRAAAREVLDQLRGMAPTDFVTWKGEAVLLLHTDGTDAARGPLRAAKARSLREGQATWAADFEALLDALDAFADGDFAAARSRLAPVRHADVQPAAAWLLARLDAIERAHEERIGAARRAGARAGLLDLWCAADGALAAQRSIAAYARQLGCPLESDAVAALGALDARAVIHPPPDAWSSAAVWAWLAPVSVPRRLRFS